MAHEFITRAQFESELRDLADRLDSAGFPVAKRLLELADRGRAHCQFECWAPWLKAAVYRQLNVQPVQMYRRIS